MSELGVFSRVLARYADFCLFPPAESMEKGRKVPVFEHRSSQKVVYRCGFSGDSWWILTTPPGDGSSCDFQNFLRRMMDFPVKAREVIYVWCLEIVILREVRIELAANHPPSAVVHPRRGSSLTTYLVVPPAGRTCRESGWDLTTPGRAQDTCSIPAPAPQRHWPGDARATG